MLDLSSKILQGCIYVGHGRIIVHLSELIESSGLSKNRFSHLAAMERTQINNYCKNNVARVDLDVLARICSVLHCSIGELLEYVPDGESQQAAGGDFCNPS